jgi:hypothetical protein
MTVEQESPRNDKPSDYPDGPMRQRDPEPDRIPRQDTNPMPNSAPAQPNYPKTVPSNNPR